MESCLLPIGSYLMQVSQEVLQCTCVMDVFERSSYMWDSSLQAKHLDN